MTKYTIAYTKEEEDGSLSGRCLELPGAISQGGGRIEKKGEYVTRSR